MTMSRKELRGRGLCPLRAEGAQRLTGGRVHSVQTGRSGDPRRGSRGRDGDGIVIAEGGAT